MNDCKHKNRTIDCRCNDCGYDFIVDPTTEKIRLQEQQRIIKLLEDHGQYMNNHEANAANRLIALIKGEK